MRSSYGSSTWSSGTSPCKALSTTTVPPWAVRASAARRHAR
ncbi:hypothetical protein RKD35_002866 [Streptomyces albogriseolus]